MPTFAVLLPAQFAQRASDSPEGAVVIASALGPPIDSPDAEMRQLARRLDAAPEAAEIARAFHQPPPRRRVRLRELPLQSQVVRRHGELPAGASVQPPVK